MADLSSMRVRLLSLILALVAVAVIPATASAAPRKVFFGFSSGGAYSTVEGNKTFNVTVQRSGNTGVAASVRVDDLGTGTAATPANYTFTGPVVVNFGVGETTKTVPITIVDNTLFEANHTIKLKLTGLTPAGFKYKAQNATITILENDGAGTIDMDSPTYSVVESAGVATITVNRESATNLTETVDYTTTQLAPGTGHATAGVDYMTTSGTLTFAPNEMSKPIQVPVLDDASYEGDETLTVSLSNPHNVTNPVQVPNLGPNATGATLTIVDDDVPTFAFSQATYSVIENAGSATITVNRSGDTSFPVSVGYSDDGSGTAAGSDYSLPAGTLNFAAGETSKTFLVTINDNGVNQANRTVGLQLTDAVSGAPVATATLSIVDDDNPSASVQFSDVAYSVGEGDGTATITATLSKAVGSTTTVHYATSDEAPTATNNPATADTTGPPVQNDYAPASGTLTFNPGETSKTFTVTIHQDTAIEGDETLDLALSTPTNAILGAPNTAVLTIHDDDLPGSVEFTSLQYNVNEAGGQATVTVHRVGGSSGAASVDYATSNGTAIAGADYTAASGTLSWTDGDSGDKTFNVPVVWDGRGEGPETVNLALSNATGADLGADSTGVLRIADDGASGPTRFSASSYTVDESAGLVTVTVTRSGGSLGGPVTVDYATGDGTATAGSDYTAASGTLTFGPGEASKSFTVPITNDSVHEDSESFQVALSNVTGGASMGSPSGATVTIADDDAAAAPATVNPQSTPSNPNPSSAQTAAKDTKAPKLTLSAKKLQKALKLKLVALAAKCDENCTLSVVASTANGKKKITIGKAKAKAKAGKKITVNVKLSKKALAQLVKALKKGKVKVTLTVVAKDAAGNAGKGSRVVMAKR